MTDPTAPQEVLQEAVEAALEAFRAVGRLPHGDGYRATLLAQAQEHLAAAVTALREWEAY